MFFYFHEKAFAHCIVLESEFRDVQPQYLWNDNYKNNDYENKLFVSLFSSTVLPIFFLWSFTSHMKINLTFHFQYEPLTTWTFQHFIYLLLDQKATESQLRKTGFKYSTHWVLGENIFIFKQVTHYRLYVTFTIMYFTKYK